MTTATRAWGTSTAGKQCSLEATDGSLCSKVVGLSLARKEVPPPSSNQWRTSALSVGSSRVPCTMRSRSTKRSSLDPQPALTGQSLQSCSCHQRLLKYFQASNPGRGSVLSANAAGRRVFAGSRTWPWARALSSLFSISRIARPPDNLNRRKVTLEHETEEALGFEGLQHLHQKGVVRVLGDADLVEKSLVGLLLCSQLLSYELQGVKLTVI